MARAQDRKQNRPINENAPGPIEEWRPPTCGVCGADLGSIEPMGRFCYLHPLQHQRTGWPRTKACTCEHCGLARIIITAAKAIVSATEGP